MTQTPPVEDRLQGFEDFVQTTMQEWQLPGLAIAIVKDSAVILSQGFGKRNVAEDLDVTPETLFAIGSCTKAFTATALGMLIDEEKLNWDTPVRQHLPAFKLCDAVASEQATARDLLSHRTGLPRHDMSWYRSSSTRDELFERLQYLEPSKGFRELWQYQNLMYMVAGYLVEVVSGQTWEDFVRQRIMEPLGMTGSNFATDASRQTSDYAMPYKKIKGEVRLVDFYDKLAAIAPAGAINSSVADMSKWVLLQLNKGKQGETQLISEARLGQIHTPYMLVPDPRKYTEVHYASYGLGWSINSYRGHLVVQHGGGIDGFSALTMLFPDDNIGMVVLTNRESCPAHTVVAFNAFERLLGLSETPWSERFKKEFDEQEEMQEKARQESASKRVLDTHPSHELSAYTGDFEHPGYGRLSVTLEDGHLQVTYNTMQCELEHYHYDIFDINYEEFEGVVLKAVFTIGVEGDVESLAIGLGLDPALGPIVFKRVAQAGDAEKA